MEVGVVVSGKTVGRERDDEKVVVVIITGVRLI